MASEPREKRENWDEGRLFVGFCLFMPSRRDGATESKMAFAISQAFISMGINLKPLAAGLKSAKGKVVKSMKSAGAAARKALSLKITLAAGAITAGLLGMATSAADFDRQMSNVATLQVENLDALRDGVNKLARDFGVSAPAQIQNLYDALSAGVPEDIVLFVLEEAAMGARAGVGSLSSALDVGTSLMNAYGLEASMMTEIMGQAVTAVKFGKTNMDELGGAVGKAAAFMNSAGVESQVFLSAIAAITTSGLPASEAVAGLKAAIANIVSPSAEAAAMAEELGLGFDAASLKSKGLAAFLLDVKSAAGGSVEDLSALFGSVEGLNVVLGLTGGQEKTFVAALAGMEDGTKNMTDAFDASIAADPSFVFSQLKEEVAQVARAAGRELLPVLIDLAKWLIPIVKDTAIWINQNRELIPDILKVAAGLLALLFVGGKLVVVFKGLIFVAGLLGGPTVLGALGTSVGGVIIALLATVLAGVLVGQMIEKLIRKTELGRFALESFFDAIVAVWNALKRLIGLTDDTFGLGQRSIDLSTGPGAQVPRPEDFGDQGGASAMAAVGSMPAGGGGNEFNVSFVVNAAPGEDIPMQVKRSTKLFIDMVRQGLDEPGALTARA